MNNGLLPDLNGRSGQPIIRNVDDGKAATPYIGRRSRATTPNKAPIHGPFRANPDLKEVLGTRWAPGLGTRKTNFAKVLI